MPVSARYPYVSKRPLYMQKRSLKYVKNLQILLRTPYPLYTQKINLYDGNHHDLFMPLIPFL
mgnify:CR=1 FL=1